MTSQNRRKSLASAIAKTSQNHRTITITNLFSPFSPSGLSKKIGLLCRRRRH